MIHLCSEGMIPEDSASCAGSSVRFLMEQRKNEEDLERCVNQLLTVPCLRIRNDWCQGCTYDPAENQRCPNYLSLQQYRIDWELWRG